MVERKEERSIGELFSQLANDTTTLVRQEVRLAKVELGQKATQAGKQIGLIALGGAVTYAGFLAIITALIALLAQYMSVWLSALIVGVVVAGIGYFLSRREIVALKQLDMTPKATVATLKEDQEWAKGQLR
jgi:xanthine/uracil permease